MIRYVIVLLILATISTQGMAQDKKISLNEALKTAVERNLDIQLEKLNVEAGRIDLDQTRAVYEPTVTGQYATSEEDSEPLRTTQGTNAITTTRSAYAATLRKKQDWGFGWSVDFNNYITQDNSEESFGKTVSSILTIGVEQQLLKGFSLDRSVPRTDEYIARGNLLISHMDMELRMTEVLQNTENAYWDLVQAIEQLKVSRQSLKLAQQLYEQNKVKIEVGTLAPIELVNTEAEIADREREVVTNENAVLAAEDALKKVMNLPREDWSNTLAPTEALDVAELKTDLQADYEKALTQRVEMRKNDRQTENARLTQKLRKNELLPELKLSANYVSNGLDIPELRQGGSIIDSNIADALSEVGDRDFPGWGVQLDVTWTPFNKAAKLNKTKADLELRRQEIVFEQTRITIHEEVRTAFRELESAQKTIKANEKALKFRQENLKAEVQKFQNGLSTNYRVAEVQKELAVAESALINSKISYLKAKVGYHKALGRLPQERRINFQ